MFLQRIGDAIMSFLTTTGIAKMIGDDWWKTAVMIVIAFVLIYLAIGKKFEPLLLLPIAIGMLLTNLPGGGLFHMDLFIDNDAINALETCLWGDGKEIVGVLSDKILTLDEIKILVDGGYPVLETLKDLGLSSTTSFAELVEGFSVDFNALKPEYIENFSSALMDSVTALDIENVVHNGGLLDFLYLGVKLGIYPCLIFIGIGAMTDFTPLIANPKSLLIGAGAQLGVFVAFAGAVVSGQFTLPEAASIGIIGGADGPTAITVTKTLAPALLGAIAIAAYSYMALIPLIQPPFMKLLTTKKERQIKMTTLRPVKKIEKLLFPIVVTAVVGLIIPDALVLVGCLMFGNLLNVCGVTDRLSETAQNAMMNIVTIFLGVTVGATAVADNFLRPQTLLIIVLGLVAFAISTVGGLITAKIMNWLSGGKINPLIGSAGVSAVPMAARVSQKVGQEADPSNFLLMHAMGPNVAGVIGSAVAAGVFLSMFA